jgi:hypothetical protein
MLCRAALAFPTGMCTPCALPTTRDMSPCSANEWPTCCSSTCESSSRWLDSLSHARRSLVGEHLLATYKTSPRFDKRYSRDEVFASCQRSTLLSTRCMLTTSHHSHNMRWRVSTYRPPPSPPPLADRLGGATRRLSQDVPRAFQHVVAGPRVHRQGFQLPSQSEMLLILVVVVAAAAALDGAVAEAAAQCCNSDADTEIFVLSFARCQPRALSPHHHCAGFSLGHSFVHSLTRLLTRLFTRSLICSLVCSLLTHLLTRLLARGGGRSAMTRRTGHRFRIRCGWENNQTSRRCCRCVCVCVCVCVC